MIPNARTPFLHLLATLALAAGCGGGTSSTAVDAGLDGTPGGSDADAAPGGSDADAAPGGSDADAAPGGSDTPDTDLDLADVPGAADVPEDVSEGSEDSGADVPEDVPEGSEDSVSDTADAVDAATDAVECDYLDLDIWIVRCGGEYVYARTFTDLGDRASCPPYTTLGTSTFPGAPDAYAALDCDPQCEWRAASSVSAMCVDGRRTGWIEYRAAEEACAPVFEFAEGLYPSVEAWNAETNCLAGE